MPGTKTRKAKAKSAPRIGVKQMTQLRRAMSKVKDMEQKARVRQSFMRQLNATMRRKAIEKAMTKAEVSALRQQMKSAQMDMEQELRRSSRLLAKAAKSAAPAAAPAASRSRARAAPGMLYPSILARNATRNVAAIDRRWKQRIGAIKRTATRKIKSASPNRSDPAMNAIASQLARIHI